MEIEKHDGDANERLDDFMQAVEPAARAFEALDRRVHALEKEVSELKRCNE